MNIAIASTGLGHISRGIEAWAADLGRALGGRAGINVLLFKGGGRAEGPGERVVRCWQRNEPRTRLLLARLPKTLLWHLGLASGHGIEQVTFMLGLLGHLRRERIDILHVQDPLLALMVQRARRFGIVKTRTILGHGTEEPLTFLRKIDYLQHLAPWHLEEAKRAGVWKPTWTAIPNFVDTQVFSPAGGNLRQELGIPADGVVVLTAAAIKRGHKRIDYLIDEFAELRQNRPGLKVWLVVAGGWERETDELVKMGKERLGDQMRFLVRFPRHRMPDLYRSADVFVLCSLKEMMPIALLEATASGLPCVVNRHPVVEWMVGPGGEAVDMAAPGGLSAALERLAADEAGRRKLGEAARAYCLENFGRERVVDQILEYYRFVMRDDGRGGKKSVGDVE